MNDTTYTLHVGANPRRLPSVCFEAQNVGANGMSYVVEVDDGGWNCWSEPIGTDTNDDVTLHILIDLRTGQRPVALDRASALLHRFAGHLKPNDHGVIAAVTDTADFSVDVHEFREDRLGLVTITPLEHTLPEEPEQADVVVEFRLVGDADVVDDALAAVYRALESSKAEVAFFEEANG